MKKRVQFKIVATTAFIELISKEFSGTQGKELKGNLRKLAKVIVTELRLGGQEQVTQERILQAVKTIGGKACRYQKSVLFR